MEWLQKHKGALRLWGYIFGFMNLFGVVSQANSSSGSLRVGIMCAFSIALILSATIALPVFNGRNLRPIALFCAILNVVVSFSSIGLFIRSVSSSIHGAGDVVGLTVSLPLVLAPIIILIGLTFVNLNQVRGSAT